MRFISKYPGFKIHAVHEKTERLADGTFRVLSPGYVCEFLHGGLTDADREVARRSFVWKGLPTAQDGSPLDPITDLGRVSVFDTEDVPEELRGQVEEFLLNHHTRGQDYVLVERVLVEAPVANWVKLTSVQGQRTVEKCAEKAVALVEELGLDVEQVLAFERQEGRKESAAIIAALEGAPAEQDAVELVSA